MPKTTRTVPLALLVVPALAGTALPVLGQTASRTPTGGDWSISVAAFEPDDDLGFGLHHMLSDRVNLGLEVDFEWTKTDGAVTSGNNNAQGESRVWNLLAGPVLKWYGTRAGPVSPFVRLHGALGWGKERVHTEGNIEDLNEVSALLVSLGIGAEWYPIPQLGIGGHTGFQVTREKQDLDPRDDLHFDFDTWAVQTFRSGIRASFYFR